LTLERQPRRHAGSRGTPRRGLQALQRRRRVAAPAAGFIPGLESRFACTGQYIPGTTMSSLSGLTFDPDGLLRTGAVVGKEDRCSNKRPYVLRSTIVSTAEPTATPLPLPAGWQSVTLTVPEAD
jgi:hypothetical protein